MQRKNITDRNILERVTKYLYDNIGNRTSMKSISENIEGVEKNSSYNTISNYVDALIDSYLIFKANRYDIKGKEYLKTQEKYYLSDIGLRTYLLGKSFGKDLGHIFENIIFLELKRRNYKIYIGKNSSNKVDFVVQTDNDLIYIQVALSVRDEETLKRELKPLNDINDHYPKYLITMDYDNNNYNGIKQISAMDFLTGKINL